MVPTRYRRTKPRPTPPPLPPLSYSAVLRGHVGPDGLLTARGKAVLDCELLDMIERAGGRATLRQLFDRDPSWDFAAPLWALAAARRLRLDGLVGYDLADDGSDVTLTVHTDLGGA